MKSQFKKQDLFIVLLSLITILFLNLINHNKALVEDRYYQEKYEASLLMQTCLEEIKEEKIHRGIVIDPKYDINKTGIIGEEYNGITTTLGSLDSKRTSANPNFAAVMVELMKKAGFKAGDNLAVNFSSSFPALNIATLAASEILDLNLSIITSIGSSTWGGNNIDFTYLDMEEILYKKQLISNKTFAVSAGGQKDIGIDMDEIALKTIMGRMRNYGKEIIREEELEKNIALRLDLYYKDAQKIKGFINIGGNLVAFGDTLDSLDTKPGLIKNKTFKRTKGAGLVQTFNLKGLPVIHILNVKDLANRYGLDIDPNYLPEVGKGQVYYSYKYNHILIIGFIIFILVSLIIFRKRTRIPYDW